MSYQISLFDIINNRKQFKIDKPIRLIELFAGYGSQHFALDYLGANFESWKICEWAIKSIQAYKDAHFSTDNTDYSKELTRDQVEEYLFNKGISSNYNNPMTLEQIKRLGEDKARVIYNNIIATHNLVSVVNCKAEDLEIIDRDKYIYMLTYSYPCQDVSKSGKLAGMAKGSGTRSSLLWEVERILEECNGNLPHVLIMENVPDVIGEKNKLEFAKWYQKLESLGYANFYKILNAKDYGIPQNRERCFMVSVLGDYYYVFPEKRKLEKRLKDFLEPHVDEKYFLSDKMIQGMINTKFESYKMENKLIDQNGIANTIIARFEGTPQCIAVKEKTKKGYSEAQDGDGVYINRPEQKRGVVQKGMIQTIKTSPDVGVVVKVGNYSPSGHNAASIVDSEGIAPTVMENHGTVTATVVNDDKSLWTENQAKMITEDLNVKRYIDSDIIDEFKEGQCANIDFPNGYGHGNRVSDNCHTITTSSGSNLIVKTKNKRIHKIIEDNDLSDKEQSFLDIYNQLRIRKLTCKENFRLMGVKDSDFEKIAKNQSNSSLYHLAGDSIVVDVLKEIISMMLD